MSSEQINPDRTLPESQVEEKQQDDPHFDEAQMLHPMTLVQRVLISIPPFVLLLIPLIRSSNSADIVPVVTLVVYAVFALPLIILRYYRFRYRITEKEIVIHSGVLTRKNRSIPIERIQNIEIEQTLLPRILGTAKVKIETAGSATTEGTLEFVGIDTAHQIREVVRTYQRSIAAQPADSAQQISLQQPTLQQPLTGEPAPPPQEEELKSIFSMDTGRVLLVGVMRFSLLYIAITFSLLEQMAPNPDEIEVWLRRGWLKPLAEYAMDSPWQLTVAAIVLAVLLSWVSGILVSFNRYFGFQLWHEGTKLHKKHGLLTLSQGTIPIPRVQTLIFRANMLMRKLGWLSLQVQTMGIEVSGRGHQVIVPIGRVNETLEIANYVTPITLPSTFQPVSKLTIRRTIIRYTMVLLILVGGLAYPWPPALWGLLALPLIPVYAYLHYKNHGYALENDLLFVRRGVIRHYIWMIPVTKFQVMYTKSSIFQRRLNLATVYVDTAGAGAGAVPEIIDIEAGTAHELVEASYAQFQASFSATLAN